jgi:hypothetical protein
MRRSVASLVILALMLSAVPARAASTPVVNVMTYGVELCPQSICGAAIFTGVLYGRVGSKPLALGTFIVAVTHDELPQPFESAAVTGGGFELAVGLQRIKGVVSGGTLFNNGDNTFTVDATLTIVAGGSGTLHYRGLLNHNVFPPTVIGPLTQ